MANIPLVVPGSVSGVRFGAAAGTGTDADPHIQKVATAAADVASASFSRPADTTQYAVADLVANSTVAASVTPMVFTVGREPASGLRILAARLRKTGGGGNSITNASFRLHLFRGAPSTSAGDNASMTTALSPVADYIGAIDITLDRQFSDGAFGRGVPLVGSCIVTRTQAGFSTLWGLLEARAAYTPVSGETFQVALELDID